VSEDPPVIDDPTGGITAKLEEAEKFAERARPAPTGIQLYINCIPSIQAMPLEGYIEGLCATIASNTNSPDIRASDHEALRTAPARDFPQRFQPRAPGRCL
jgi:hypothetical protein